MSGTRSLNADVDLDIKGLFSAIWRKKWLILFVTVLFGALLFAALSFVSPRYKSDAQILIKKRESVFTRIATNELQQTGGEFDEQAVGSQVIILSSDDLASKVIKKLDLENHPEFQKKASSAGLLDLARKLIAAPQPDSAVSQLVDSDQVVNPGVLKQFKEQLTVYAADKSRIAIVEFWSKDRALAQKVPNALAEVYLEFTRNSTLDSDENATNWLGPEIDALRTEVAKAEAKVAEFRSSSDILLGNNNSLLATQQLSEVSSELSRVRADVSSAEAKLASIRSTLASGGSVDAIPEVISSPLIQRLRERQVALQAEISQLSTTLLANHPRIKALRSQLPDLENQIRIAARNIVASLENNVDLARKQESVLIQDVNRLKAESSRVGEAEVQLRALEREATSQRERLESYLGRFNEAQSRQAGGYVPSEARIIEHAVVPSESYFPKVVPFTLAGMTAIALLTMVGVLAAELLSGRAFKPMRPVDENDIPERVIANAPGIVPEDRDLMVDPAPVARAPQRAANDRDVFGMNFARQAIEGIGSGLIAVATPDGSEAGTGVTLDTARHLASSGYSVVIVDLTSDNHTARTLLGENDLPGLGEVLDGRNTLREVLYSDTVGNAHILGSGSLASATSDLSKLPDVINALLTNYDYVVVDCGNVGINGLARIADAETIVLIPVDGADFADCRQMERNFQSAGYLDTIMIRLASGRQNHVTAA
jgi:exopolysaccharide transport family protein